jgi:AraC-like DNA-binding protein
MRIRVGGTFARVASRTVAIQFVRAAVASAETRGLDIAEVLREAGISQDLIAQDATRVTPAQAVRAVQALWDATDDELLGIGPKAVTRGTFRMITFGLIHAPDLRTALRRLVEFTGIAAGFNAIEMTENGGSTRVSLGLEDHANTDQLVVDIMMAIVHRFASWLIGDQIALDSVQLPGAAPPHVAEYLLIYGVAPKFEAHTAALTFGSRYLEAPVMRSEADLAEFIKNSPTDLLFRQDYQPTTSSRVRKIVERARGDEAVTAEDVARRLTVSGQHLRRLLREDGTTFRDIKEEILRDEAIASLVRGRETVEELSERLGFSEPSAFRRAFRRWTGNPPGSYRVTDGGP